MIRALRPAQHVEEIQLKQWIAEGLQLANIHGKLTRRGVVVPYRTLHRFAVQRCGFGRQQPTLRSPTANPATSASWTSAGSG
jgi:hypothetical protein